MNISHAIFTEGDRPADSKRRSSKFKRGCYFMHQKLKHYQTLPCGLCGQKPKLQTFKRAATLQDKTLVDHYILRCKDCIDRYDHVEGAHFETWDWKSYRKTVWDWNGIVKGGHSWYVGGCNFQLKIDL